MSEPPSGARVGIADLGDRLRVTVELPLADGEPHSRRHALARAWEALAAEISLLKSTLPPVPLPPAPRSARKRGKRPARTGSGSWWQF